MTWKGAAVRTIHPRSAEPFLGRDPRGQDMTGGDDPVEAAIGEPRAAAQIRKKEGSLPTHTTRMFNNDNGANPVRRPEPSLAPSATYAPTKTASGGSAGRSPLTRQRCSCCGATRPACEPTDAEPNRNVGRHLRRITVTWFCAWVVASLLLWQGFVDEAQWSEQPSDSYYHQGVQGSRASHETG